MSTRNERFADGFLSLDRALEGVTKDKCALLADNGAGARRIVAAADWDPAKAEEAEIAYDNRRLIRYLIAARIIDLCHIEQYLPVLDEVIANGPRWKSSVLRLSLVRHIKRGSAKSYYFRGARVLRKLFLPNE